MNKDEIIRGLVQSPKGSSEWRRFYSAYRKTEHWKAKRAEKLAKYPFCQLTFLMTKMAVHADEVHHSEYSHWFAEDVDKDLVSVVKRNHQLWENRFGRKG